MTTLDTTPTTWSSQQRSIFSWFGTPPAWPHNAIVRARAGTGKTTVILEGVARAPERRILEAAFNKRIQVELETRNTNRLAEARTLHAVGRACVKRYWSVRICERHERGAALTDTVCGPQAPDAMRKLVTRLHTKGREMAPHARQLGDLTDILIQFDCAPDAEWEPEGFDAAWVEQKALDAMELAATRRPVDTGIDFADMIYLPIRNRWLRPAYDLVVVDEAQDMTVAQLEIARGVCSGRLMLVGDDRQAIYGFRGADSESLDRLKADLRACELGLTTTYRCGKAIVALAKEIVPDFEAGADNPEGQVSSIGYEALAAAAQGGNFILSRVNAPLMRVAMALIRTLKPVKVVGKDIGAGLKALVERLAHGQDIATLLDRLAVWTNREVQRAVAAKREDLVEELRDKAETLRVLTEGVTGVAELQARIDGLFTDVVVPGMVICSSVHKAKGLEADTVFVLRDTLGKTFAPKKGQVVDPARLAREAREEDNIRYVAITRAKTHLVWVDGLPA